MSDVLKLSSEFRRSAHSADVAMMWKEAENIIRTQSARLALGQSLHSYVVSVFVAAALCARNGRNVMEVSDIDHVLFSIVPRADVFSGWAQKTMEPFVQTTARVFLDLHRGTQDEVMLALDCLLTPSRLLLRLTI